MSEVKPKKGVRRSGSRRMAGGATPNPDMDMASCGHSHCKSHCRVRYVGAVSHLRDHHILHAARGVANIWTAVVITGLAVVLTGAVAFTSVQAKTDRETEIARGQMVSREDFAQLMARLGQMEKSVHDVRELCGGKMPGDMTSSTSKVPENSLPKTPKKK